MAAPRARRAAPSRRADASRPGEAAPSRSREATHSRNRWAAPSRARWAAPSRARWLAALLLVAVGWLATPSPVPVYDGVGQPDEPYRYVTAPAGSPTTRAVLGATGTVAVTDGLAGGLSLTSDETGPQVAVYLPAGALTAPAGPLRVTVAPVRTTAPPPGATVAGNVYRITTTSPAGAVRFSSRGEGGSLYLRAPTARQPGPSCVHRSTPTSRWATLKTLRVGNDVYTCGLPGAGDYALAFSAAHSRSGVPVLPIVVVGALLVLGAVLVAVRLRSRPVAAP